MGNKIIKFISTNIVPLLAITVIILSIILPKLFVYIKRRRNFPRVSLTKMEIISKEEENDTFKVELETPKGKQWIKVNNKYYHSMDVGDYACCHVTHKHGTFKKVDFIF